MADALDPACPFCRMVLGTEPYHGVAEDADTLAFLSRRPINPGHVLVIPKRHVPDFDALEEGAYLRLMAVVRRLAPAVRAATRPVKVGVVIAGFDVPHTHVHLISLHD